MSFDYSWRKLQVIFNLDMIDVVYMVPGPTDLRKGIDGHSALISSVMNLDPFEKNLDLFCNRAGDKIKILYWDGSGFWLFYKRLESGKFKWLKTSELPSLHLSLQQFRWLMEGLEINQKTAFKPLENKVI